MNLKSYAGRRRRKGRHLSFDPNSEFIAQAVDDFLKGGGEITQLESRKIKNPESWIAIDDNLEADEFLNEA
jgi:hypothetical protein